MTVVALGFFLTGLVLGVYAMLYGTERSVQPVGAPHERQSAHELGAEPSPVFNLASLAAFAVGFGLAGYLLTRSNDLDWYWQLLMALAAGSATFLLQATLIARWAIPGARADQVDERYLLQGTLAQITEAVSAQKAGQLSYTLDGLSYRLPARSMDGNAVAVGTDVVIDRVEQGIAYTELWTDVEQRL